MQTATPGTLYLVATPIGNLSDITLRAIEILKSVDIVACEDTRHTGTLLKHLAIKKPLQSFHEHSKDSKRFLLIDELQSGKSVALVSDAGTPLISDPGFPLVREAIENQIRIESIPGPSAVISALVVSGFSCEPFAFFGYLPNKEKKRREVLESVLNEEKTLIFYESPHRLVKSLHDISDIFQDRRIAVARELTKKFEETVRGRAAEVFRHFEKRKILGEFVIIIEGIRE